MIIDNIKYVCYIKTVIITNIEKQMTNKFMIRVYP